jgi:hypothetical protein
VTHQTVITNVAENSRLAKKDDVEGGNEGLKLRTTGKASNASEVVKCPNLHQMTDIVLHLL